MRFFIIYMVILWSFSSCKNQTKVEDEPDYTGFTEKRIVLIGTNKEYKQEDTLAELFIKIPSRLDTFYQWHNMSDCLPCGRIQYRFADKKYPQYAESGMFWTFKPDSVYQLTITHNPIRESPDSIQMKPVVIADTTWRVRYPINEAIWCEKASFVKKDFKIINNRSFFITCFISECSLITSTTSLFFAAQTTLRNRHLNFLAECRVIDSTGFINNMYKALLSVKIEEKRK